ncbi:MAG: XapX domain-containing protein [Halobacteriaceae archaeon]
MNSILVIMALITGLLAGGLFAFLQIPIPAPPNMSGIMGIVGIYLGYKIVTWLDLGFNLLAVLGLQ